MEHIFIGVLNHAWNTSFLILAVLIVRLAVKRAPKWISCALWGLVALRLVLPVSVESVLSLVPSTEPIPENIVYSEAPNIDSGFSVIDKAVNPVIQTNLAPEENASADGNPMQTVIGIGAAIWVMGVVVLLCYLLVTWLLLKRRVAAAEKVGENVYISDEAAGPFLLGVLRPRVYLPSGLSEDVKECVLAHERAHIERLDHLWKPLGYLILSVYWFHPLCWVSYILLCRDIELACDEKVTKDRDKEWKAVYCQALLDCSLSRKLITACPVAFGEVSIKDRVKSVLNYKKPAFWIIFAALAVSAVVAVCFMTDPKSPAESTAKEWDTTETLENLSSAVDENGEPHSEKTEDITVGENAEQGLDDGAPDTLLGEASDDGASDTFPEETPDGGVSDVSPVEGAGIFAGEASDIPFAEGRFDNIFGYAGYYQFFDTIGPYGYYYADDGTLIAYVWGASPESVGIVDLDGDGENELVSQVTWMADGGRDVVVYKKFPDGIRQAYGSDLMDREYDNRGVGSRMVGYLKNSNEIKISYNVDADGGGYREATYHISCNLLNWREPDWLIDSEESSDEKETVIRQTSFWGDQRDWPCGYIVEAGVGKENKFELVISLQYYIHPDDTELVERFGLTEEYFPSGVNIRPMGKTIGFPLSETCEYSLVDVEHLFDNDSRVEHDPENGNVLTTDYSVFWEYMGGFTENSLNTHRYLLFFDIRDGVIEAIYESPLP